MIKLTKRQQEILDLIKSHKTETGYPPTRQEIAAHFGFKSANAAEEHLKALAKKGIIEMIPGASRGIRILGEEEENLGLPIVGKVAAGEPLMSASDIQGHCQIPPEFFSPKADYFLRVQGESMIEAGIMDGDLIAVHHQETANNGEIIVARVDDEVTVKTLKKGRSAKNLTLLPENADYEPIEIDLSAQAFSIEGIMVGVIRR